VSDAILSLSEYQRIIAEKDAQIERLLQTVAELQRAVFGTRSEKRRPQEDEKQASLFALPEEPAPESDTSVEVSSHQRVRSGRKPLPEHLPRERVEYEPEERTCSCCGKELSKIGEEVTEELEYQPAKLFVRQHVRIKRACSCCKSGVSIGTLPAHIPLIEKGRPGLGLLTYITIAKYGDGMPLYRLSQVFERHGSPLPRQRLCDWIGHVVFFLEGVVGAMWKELRKEEYLLADETTIKVQDAEVKGRCHTGYLWGMLGPPGVVFHYADSRASEVPKELLADIKHTLYLQTDAYAGYNPVYVPDRVYRIGCFAHVRRKFIACEKTIPKETGRVLALIGKLYKLEKQIKQLDDTKKYLLRQQKAVPLLAELKTLLEYYQKFFLPKHPVQEALSYTLKQWTELSRYTEQGKFAIDNNAIERQMRPIAVGRKAWLFAGSHEGARRAAVLFSLLNSCKMLKINPQSYIADVLKRRAQGEKAELLTPCQWKKLQRA